MIPRQETPGTPPRRPERAAKLPAAPGGAPPRGRRPPPPLRPSPRPLYTPPPVTPPPPAGCGAHTVSVRVDEPTGAKITITEHAGAKPVETTAPFVARIEAGSASSGGVPADTALSSSAPTAPAPHRQPRYRVPRRRATR
mgnify:CR=1 FL=1